MIPWSSPRSSGCRATDWIIEPKIWPMPIPAPSEPSPIPSASAIALPRSTTFPSVWKRISSIRPPWLVLGLDRRADVDGGQGGEDERLDRDDDDDLEEVERRRHQDREREDPDRGQEDEPDER